MGRPITYNGDPNSPNLTEEERRKVSTVFAAMSLIGLLSGVMLGIYARRCAVWLLHSVTTAASEL